MSKIISSFQRRLRQKDIAKALGVTEGAVSHIILGRRKSPILRAKIEKFIKQQQAA